MASVSFFLVVEKVRLVLRIAIIGCGKIADSHAAQIRRIRDCRLDAACDRESLLARQLTERFGIQKCFSDPAEMLQKSRPDVVHITTPPQSHFELGKLCLDAGCHVYVEKPFTIDTREARELIRIAEVKKLKLTVGHNAQFTHAARRMRKLVEGGYLGGEPVHMESTWCYELSDPGYAKAMLSDKQHWLRKLPGRLLQNIVSHGIARLAEFIQGNSPIIKIHCAVSPLLRKLGENRIIDELRMIIVDGDRTGYFTFSSQMRPSHHQFRVYGPRNGLLLDEDQQTVIKLRGSKYKSFGEHFIPPLSFATQYLHNWMHNLGLFLGNEFHQDESKKFLFEAFYRAIRQNGDPPIPYRQIILTSHIMDSLFVETARFEAGF